MLHILLQILVLYSLTCCMLLLENKKNMSQSIEYQQGSINFLTFAGKLYATFGDYRVSFYFAGTAVSIAGAIFYPLACINRWEKKQTLAVTSNAYDQGEVVHASPLNSTLQKKDQTRIDSI